jgi:hypothetical protein
MEKEIEWSDGSTKYQWCNDCVPRGCSCEQEHFFIKSDSDIKDRDYFTFKEDLNEIKIRLEKDINSIEIYLSETGVSYSEKDDSYILELNDTNYKIIDNYLLFNENFINTLLNNTEYSLMLQYVDNKKRPYPCCEVMHLEETYKKEKGEIHFSLYHNQYLLIHEVYKNGNFRAYPLNNMDTKEIDNSNAVYYNKTGFSYDSSNLDLLITEYEAKDEEFLFLNKFVFNTYENTIFEELEKSIDITKYKSEIEEYNDDIGFYFEMYSLNNKTVEELYVQGCIQTLLMEHFRKIFNGQDKTDFELFDLLIKYHKINDSVKYSDALDSSIHYGCDCGCGGDSLTDEDFDRAGVSIDKRKNLFIEIFKIVYYTVITKDRDEELSIVKR